MNEVFLSLGGNMGNRFKYLEETKWEISKHVGHMLKSSAVYETDAWGSNSTQKYLNQVIKISTPLNPKELLFKTDMIERKLGRKRNSKNNIDRTVDIDILFFNAEVIREKNLQIPHPRLHLRKFVLVPFNELDKTFIHPQLHQSIGTLLKNCTDTLKVIKYKTKPKPLYICIEGNIGSGKSTLAKQLSMHLKANYLPEQFEQNYLLPLFYENKNRYSFPLEFSFLISRFELIMQQLTHQKQTIVSDFSIYKCLWFAKCNLTKTEFLLFEKHFQAFVSQLPRPDLFIYLDTEINNLQNNIKKRGRPYEQSITTNYLQKISAQYNKGIKQLNLHHKVNITVKKYDASLQKAAIKTIENYLKENFG